MIQWLKKPAQRWASREDTARLARHVPASEAAQSSSRRQALRWLESGERASWRVLDLGCGAGGSHDFMAATRSLALWVGIDIPDSPEAAARRRRDLNFVAFDGVRIPFAPGTFDLVYCHQVLEHVRHPQRLLAEAARVLCTGGVLVGSTSQLEPFHSRSLWNYTAYGMLELLQEAGLRQVEIRPGIDGLTLVLRRLFGFAGLSRPFNFFFEHSSPLNVLIELAARAVRIEPRMRAVLKLVFAGQFVFVARKTELLGR